MLGGGGGGKAVDSCLLKTKLRFHLVERSQRFGLLNVCHRRIVLLRESGEDLENQSGCAEGRPNGGELIRYALEVEAIGVNGGERHELAVG